MQRRVAWNKRDIQGRTALHILASNGGELSLLDVLLWSNADPRITDELDYTALYLAVKFGHFNLVPKLSQAVQEPIHSLDEMVSLTPEVNLLYCFPNCEGGYP